MRTTETQSRYDNLDKMSTEELLRGMNQEDKTVPEAISKSIPRITEVVDHIVERMRRGGRVFYIGAGTSGRLGVLDASEILPTYGVKDIFIGIIAGGDIAFRTPVEGAEDDPVQGWKDMEPFHPTADDTLIGISASGYAPYVCGAIRDARAHGLFTSCITCNAESELIEVCELPIITVVGPEFVTGSTRMKSGTAAKLILNMISTSVMIRLGHVKGNHMVDMQITNSKLVDRGTRMIMAETGIEDYDKAHDLLIQFGGVRPAVNHVKGL